MNLEGLNVLVVDDEEEFATTLVERLQLRHIDARLAKDGDEALAAIAQDRPAVVLLDVLMPGISGIQVLQRIKRNDPAIQVILLTGHGSTRDGIRGMQLGAFDYMMKPVDIDHLMERMGAAFERFKQIDS